MRAHLANMVKGVTDGLRRASSRSTASVTAPRSRATSIDHGARLLAPGGVQAARRASRAKVDKNQRRSLAERRPRAARRRPRRRSASFARPSRTRARASSTSKRSSSGRPARPAPRASSGSRLKERSHAHRHSYKKREPQEAAPLASASGSTGPPSVRAWRCSAARAHIYAQVDRRRRTKTHARRLDARQGAEPSRASTASRQEGARQAGRRGDRQAAASAKGIDKVVFDRNGLHVPRPRHGARRRRARSRA